MRKQFSKTVEEIMHEDKKVVVLLGDIGVYGFRNVFTKFPDRIYNIGILEQATIGVAAGLALTRFTPIVHTIAPFLVERSLEQLKVDFGYQQLGGNFVSVGSSYDYAALGCTHHCPADVATLRHIPGMEIVLPGTAEEFHHLFRAAYGNGRPTYFRISEKQNAQSYLTTFGKAHVVKKGKRATIIAVGPLLDTVLEAAKNFDVTILYYNSVAPFDTETLRKNATTKKMLLCEPYYSGVLLPDVMATFSGEPVQIDTMGMTRTFLAHYGNATEHDEAVGLTAPHIAAKIKKLIHA
jgi:transketolase